MSKDDNPFGAEPPENPFGQAPPTDPFGRPIAGDAAFGTPSEPATRAEHRRRVAQRAGAAAQRPVRRPVALGP